MESCLYLCMIFPIPAHGNTRVYGKFPSANEKSLYVYGTFKSMEEKPYFLQKDDPIMSFSSFILIQLLYLRSTVAVNCY